MTDIALRNLPTLDALQPLVDRGDRFGLTNRAHKAAQMAVDGKVTRLPSAGRGHDRWRVEGATGIYHVSVSDHLCGCKFHAINGRLGGYDALCSHQLAAIFLSLWWGMGNRVLPDQALDPIFAEAQRSGEVLDWRLTVRFNNQVFDTAGRRMASANQEVIEAYRIHSRTWIELSEPVVVGGHTADVIHPDLFRGFWEIVDRYNWRLAQRMRVGSFEFIYRFVPYEAELLRIGEADPWRKAVAA